MADAILTQERLKELLHYDPTTGLFTWRINRSPKTRAGDIAGSLDQDGYIKISINHKGIFAHRLAFLYMEGSMPVKFVDHIDMVKNNNSWSNLRQATNAENRRNVGKTCKNTSGYKGVTWISTLGKYKASCKIMDKQYYIGMFDDPAMASKAYQEFAKKHHKDFYRQA
jgi:hypothetical protein